MKANEILDMSKNIMQDRQHYYGSARINQGRIASRLTNLFSFPIEDYEACLAMVEVKLSRIQESPKIIDHYVDACAYLAMACELLTEEDELYV